MANTHIHGTKADTSTMGGTKAIHIKKRRDGRQPMVLPSTRPRDGEVKVTARSSRRGRYPEPPALHAQVIASKHDPLRQ